MNLRSNIIANYLGQGWIALMNVAFVPYYLDLLGVESFALIGFFLMLQTVVSVLDLGMTPAISREMSRFVSGVVLPQEIRDLLRTIETIAWAIALSLLISAIVVSPLMASYWFSSKSIGTESLQRTLCIMAFVLAVRFVENVYKGSLMGLQRQVLFNIVNVSFTTIRQAGAVFVLQFVMPSIDAFLAWQAIISVASLVVMGYCVYSAIPRSSRWSKFSLDSLRNIRRFALGMVGITSVTILLTQVDKIMLSKLLSLEQYGYYSLATMISGVLSLLVAPISQAVYPRFVACCSNDEEDSLIRTYHLSSQLVSVLVAPIACVLSFDSHGVVFGWTGDRTIASATYSLLTVLTIGCYLNCVMWIPYQCMLAHGWTRLTFIGNCVAAAILIPSLPFVISRYGAVGAATIWFILNLGYLFFSIHFFHRTLLKNEKWSWYLSDVLYPTAAAFAAVLLFSLIPVRKETAFHWQVFLVVETVFATVAACLGAANIRSFLLREFSEFAQQLSRSWRFQ